MAIETVLLPVGPSDVGRVDRLVEETIDVADPTGATVVLAHVFTDDEFQAALSDLSLDPDAEGATPDQVAGRHSTIREIAASLDEAGVRFEIRGGVGPHGERIVELAEAADADLVFVGGRRRSPAGKVVFGSTAQEVMLTAPCPVVFVRSDTE